MMEAKERQRERTTAQYYDLHFISHIHDEPPISGQFATPSQDTGLTSFAQLCALRLNARRCLISLFDAQLQYVIAEATSSLPLRPDSAFQCDEGDQLWLSRTAIKRAWSICEHVLLKERHLHSDSASPNMIASQDVSVIPNLAEDARFKDKPYVSTNPYSKFYAGCPIRTVRGIDIGVVGIFDTEARPQGLDSRQTEFLIDISETVMRHLESQRARLESRRSERMVRGIGSFVEGSSTLAGWWSNYDTASFQRTTGGEGLLDATQQGLAQQAIIHPESGREMALTDSNIKDGVQAMDTSTYHGSDVASPQIQTNGYTMTGVEGNNDQPTLIQQSLPSPIEVKNRAIKTAFAKAANIIRESLEIEGIVFLDARISSFGGMVDAGDGENNGSPSEDTDSTSKSNTSTKSRPDAISNQPCQLLAYASSDGSTINNTSGDGIYPMSESTLKSFLRRYRTGKIFKFDKTGYLQTSESDELDETFGRSIPLETGPLSSKAPSVPQKRKKTRRSRINDAAVILKLIPGARLAIFFPLWDSTKQRWYAGAIAWTRNDNRPFSARGELSYLSAFGNTIMSQIARLDALAVDKAKTDLLGSISHELRSPLHGILGGVEMLTDTMIDPFQNDVLHTIQMCGRTLLDTIDHLLDFAQINNFMQTRKVDKTHGVSKHDKSTKAKDMGNLFTDSGTKGLHTVVELDILAEEVVESIFAGQQYSTQTSKEFDASQAGGMVQVESPEQPFGIAVILDIDYSGIPKGNSASILIPRGWSFYLAPGSLRRIIMNIFANALKYTTEGTIRVSLSYAAKTNSPSTSNFSDLAITPAQSATHEIVLRVSDTGRGISSDFINNQMFTPFTQEDRLNPGTGLGLSIAHQITSHLGGSINVSSHVGVGTEFTIKLPLLESDPSTGSESANTLGGSGWLKDYVKVAKGLRVALVGFTDTGVASTAQTSRVSGTIGRRPSYAPSKSEWSLPRKEIENICGFRLAMEVLPAPTDTSDLFKLVPRPEILLTTEQHIKQLISDLIETRDPGTRVSVPPIVVVCRSMRVAKTMAKEHDASKVVVDFISQPCGPRKLAEAFALSLIRWSEEKDRLEGESPATVVYSPERGPSPQSNQSNDTLDPDVSPRGPSPARSSNSETKAEGEVGSSQGKDSYLLVDDNVINLRILVNFMRKAKLAHDTADNGLVAFQKYKENHNKYRCIFMDLSMPVMSGLEASREIRAFEQVNSLQPVVIVALTALASESVQQEAFASGIDVFLTKPVRLKDLSDVIVRNVDGNGGASGD